MQVIMSANPLISRLWKRKQISGVLKLYDSLQLIFSFFLLSLLSLNTCSLGDQIKIWYAYGIAKEKNIPFLKISCLFDLIEENGVHH